MIRMYFTYHRSLWSLWNEETHKHVCCCLLFIGYIGQSHISFNPVNSWKWIELFVGLKAFPNMLSLVSIVFRKSAEAYGNNVSIFGVKRRKKRSDLAYSLMNFILFIFCYWKLFSFFCFKVKCFKKWKFLSLNAH